MRTLIVGTLGLGIALTGCSSSSDSSKPLPAPEFQAGQGQAPIGTEAYAPGPYGISKGSVIANYQFVGFPNEQADMGQGGLKVIQMADFYNPTGDGVYPEGSPYGAGQPKPKVLLIDVASVWCGPCNEEAKSVLPGKHAAYKPRGGEFILQLADGPTPGTPAVPQNLFNWASKYKVDFPATIDPALKLSSLFQADAFPANFMIDTKTMQIVLVVAGVPPQSFWTKYESFLNPAQ
jgi:hypothetical protein